MMDQLSKEGANFNHTDYRGIGPIHIAVFNNNYDQVKFLIDQGVNLDLIDNDGKSALFYACSRKHSQIVKLLSDAGATVQVSQDQLCQILCQAASHDDLELIVLFGQCEVDMNVYNFDKRSVGHIAASEDRVKILEYLSHNKRFNFLSRDRWGKSTLDIMKWSKEIPEEAKKNIL